MVPGDRETGRMGSELAEHPWEEQWARRAERDAEQAARHASPWLERLARLGYVAGDVVYVIVGALAVGVAVGIGGWTTDERGALEVIGAQPLLGGVLLISIALGLASYVLWQLLQAVADPDGEGCDARGIAKRIGHGFRALLRVGLAFTAGRLVLESAGESLFRIGRRCCSHNPLAGCC